MLKGLNQKGKDLAKEFVDSKQDLYVMTTNVPTEEGEEQITVTVKFSPKTKVKVKKYTIPNSNELLR